ncbi:hypothetical protein GPROT2_01812 [Gammaproteobacteria bacterium]|nr:hypothetical protein GPROT2_01812 [Gammaproteobacteria bacterium]
MNRIHAMFAALAALFLAAPGTIAQTAPQPAQPPGLQGKPAEFDPYAHRSNFVVADLERAFGLYRDILGFEVAVAMPVKPESFLYDFFGIPHEARLRIAFLRSPGGRFGAIGMTEVKGVALAPVRSRPYPSVLIVEVQKRIESVRAKILAAEPKYPDVGPILELTNPSRREFPVTDHDGNRIIVMQLHAAD